MSSSIKNMPAIELKIQPNAQGTHLVWCILGADGTKASGFAKCYADAMRDAAAFVETMAQPRVGGVWTRPTLRAMDGGKNWVS